MSTTIDFGIDLGTTNSVIAKFLKGEVQVFKDPITWKDTLPSVVGFRKDTIIVGNKAKERQEKDPKNVFGSFKRKMGTSESFKVHCLNQSKTPIELSSNVLKELKNFVQTGESLDAAVITIPASFDTIQSNATKEAGIMAGFKQVVLLQEPIAASLAYANKTKDKALDNGQWLVYDLGGGTFDVALVRIQNGEMKILDHEGDNFLGGADFDRLIIEKLIVPTLEKKGCFSDLEKEMKSAAGKYNNLFYKALLNAETAKIELSARTSAEISFETQDDNEDSIDFTMTITRSEFENLIRPFIDNSIDMVKKIITRNALTRTDIQFVLMVGGSTYIPYVRKRVQEVLEVPINCDIDPTTAVGIGAAYYAGTKQKILDSPSPNAKSVSLKVKMAYQKATNELEEFFAAKFEGNVDSLFYRILREDSGFDSGLKPLTTKIQEDLPLVTNSYNFFKLKVYDKQNNIIETDADLIGIAQGKFSVVGQPLPNDICLQIDDLDQNRTKLELIFPKNAILPLKVQKKYTLNKTIVKGSDDFLQIHIVEGPSTSIPEANLSIGHMVINGHQIMRDIIKGSDIEISFEISESRDIIVKPYLNMADQEFLKIFNPKERHTPVSLLNEQIADLTEEIEKEISEAEAREEFETAKILSSLKNKSFELQESSICLAEDDVTDERYQIEDKKRKLAEEVYNATKDKIIQKAKADYFETKELCSKIVGSYGNDFEMKVLDEIVKQEPTFLSSNYPQKIQEKIDELWSIIYEIRWRTPAFLKSMFDDLATNYRSRFNDQDLAKSQIEAGRMAIENENWDRLRDINIGLLNLLPNTSRTQVNSKIGFS